MSKTPKKGIVTIAFDDAYLDTYKHAIRYLNMKNIRSTISIPVSLMGGSFENRPLMGPKELRASINFGHEVASHGLTHVNLLKLSSKDNAAVISEIKESKKILASILGYRISSFVFPYIKRNYSKALCRKVKTYYTSSRVTRSKPCFNKIHPKDAFEVFGFAVMKKHTVPYLNKLVDYVHKNNLWLIEVFHLVSRKNTLSAHRPKPYRYFMHINDFKKHIDYILSKGIKILPQCDAI